MAEGLADYRARAHFDRVRLLDEIHRRSPQAIGPVARVSFMSRVFPTLEEEFTQAVRAPENTRALGATGARATVDALLAQTAKGRTRTINKLTDIMARTERARSQRRRVGADAAEQIATLRGARWHGAAAKSFNPAPQASASATDPSAAQLWLTWPRDTCALRLSWELFSNNQNFTVIEDLRDDVSKSPAFLDTLVQSTALDNLVAGLDTPPQWTGDLLLLAHYWIVPLDWVLRRGGAPDDAINAVLGLTTCADPNDKQWTAEHRSAFAVMAAYARDLFRIADPLNAGEIKQDFVFAAIADGRAFMLSDLRTHGGEAAGLPFRTLILDGGLSPEQRGRIVRYTTDIEAYRILSLRGYPFVQTFDNALAQLSVEIKTVESGINQVAPKRSFFFGPARKLEKLYAQLRLISSMLSVLNFFMTHGVSGRRLTSSTFGSLTANRAASLRERRVPGFSTLSSFLLNFHGSLGNMERVAHRYDILRRRIVEAADLIRAESQLDVAWNQVLLARWAIVAAVAFAVLGDISPAIRSWLVGASEFLRQLVWR